MPTDIKQHLLDVSRDVFAWCHELTFSSRMSCAKTLRAAIALGWWC